MLEDILQDLQNKKSLFETGVHTELRVQENRSRIVCFTGGNLVNNNRAEELGVCARVCKNGVYGFSSAAEYSEEKVKAVLQAATQNADFMYRHAGGRGKALPALASGFIPARREIVDTEQREIISACREIDGYIVKKFPGLAGRTVYYSEDSFEKLICTSDGKDGRVTSPRCYIYVTLSAMTEQGTPVELTKIHGGPGSFGENFCDLTAVYQGIDAQYDSLMKKREGIYPEAGYKTVILDGMMSGMLAHEAVGHTTEADLVKSGSVAGPALGKMVASEKVSMVDFAHTALGEAVPLPVYLDDEGVQAEDVEIIKNGRLTGYMNNRESALHFGMEPKGNARAWAFSDEPLIRMRNTAVLPGTDKLEDMIASVEDGYYLLDSGNGQADVTGEFMFGVCQGYEIKKGKIGRALLDTTVSGVAFDMLKTVDMVSDELLWQSCGFCGKKQRMSVSVGGPALRCKIMIGGR